MPLSTYQLPVRLTPLVGREAELTDVATALTRGRLLTLTGPGGTGKTRLALAAAAAAAGGFPAGACWVELAPVEDPGIVAHAVAARIGVPETPGLAHADALAEHIADKKLLIVLDNCEHLADAAAALTEHLLATCPSLVVLATSRETLGVEGERSWPVPPLSLPPQAGAAGAAGAPDAAGLAAYDAIKLFEQRAQLVLPSFRLTDENADAVLRICQRLDGLPLAIELAAARLRILSAAQLAGRLDDMFTLLVGGARSAPPRHQALRAALDWSYDLLSQQERAVFRRLAVFAGGFTLDAAEQVATASLDLLTRLADKSLLRVEHSDAGTRYHLLGVIRDYAREQLAGSPDAGQAVRVHLAWFADFAEQAGARVQQGAAGNLEAELDRLDAELPNLRTALEAAHAQAGDSTVAALRIAAPLDRFAYLRAHYLEVRQWMDAAVNACPDAPAVLRARALLGSGRLALLQCDYAPAVRRLEAALRLYRELGDPIGIAAALQVLGSISREQGRYARAVELHTESLAVAREAGDHWAVASAQSYLAFAGWLQLDLDNAATLAATALATFRELSDVEGEAWSLISLGAVARLQSQAERSMALLSQARELSAGIGFQEGVAWAAEQLGLLAAAADAGGAGAVRLLRESLDLHTELRDRWRMSSVLEDLAACALDQGNAGRAARLLGAAEALRLAIGTVIAPAERAQHTATTAGAESALGEGAFAAARQQGLLATAEDLRADLPRAGARAADTASMPVINIPASPAHPTSPTVPISTGPLRIRALGGAAVRIGDTTLTAADWGYAKPRELLFLLASSPPMTKEQIGAALWPDQSGRQLGNSLHTALRELRRALGDPGWVQYADRQYRFDRSRQHECDVTAFEDALTAARRARPSTAGLADLQRAVAAYGGDFLDGMAAGEWALVRRDELRRAYESALVASGRMLAAEGRHQAAAAAFRRAVAHEPLNETAHRELMSSWAAMGETARAVRHYEELTGLLRKQVGVAPAAETTALYRKLQAAG